MLAKQLKHCCMPAQPQADKFSIDYSLGQVAGRVVLDTVSLGQPPTRVTQQALGLATNSTADFSTTSCDGVFVSLPNKSSEARLTLLMLRRRYLLAHKGTVVLFNWSCNAFTCCSGSDMIYSWLHLQAMLSSCRPRSLAHYPHESR